MSIDEIKTIISEQHLKYKIEKLNKVLNLYFVKIHKFKSVKLYPKNKVLEMHLKTNGKGYSDWKTKIPIKDINLVIDRYKRKIKYKSNVE